MQQILNIGVRDRSQFYTWAMALALVTVAYNIIEGVVSVFFGLEDRTMALFGFGIDSFVEVISGVGILHMVRRMQTSRDERPDRFEKTALKVTGTAFYLLTAGLAVTGLVNMYEGTRPRTTLWGIIVSVISIVSMGLLIHYKMKAGRRYGSPALIADANCTKTCLYLSVVLLAASVGYELTGVGMIDSAGALGIAWMSLREGREAFEKSRGSWVCGCGEGCGS